MTISQEHAILITNLYLSKQYGARRLLSELADRSWKHGSIIRQSAEENPQDRLVQLSGNQVAVDRVRRIAMKDLMLSQEDKPKKAPIS